MKEWIQQLIDKQLGTIIENEPLKKRTTWKIGGPADAFIIPAGQEKLIKTIEVLNENQISWKVIGKGSNLLVLDEGYRGAIISLEHEAFRTIQIESASIKAGSSGNLIRLANLAAKQGLTGLEFAGGIPGTVGGAVYMNAGAHGSDISEVLKEASVLDEMGEVKTWLSKDFDFSYRTSILQRKKGIILSAVFNLEYGDRKKIANDMALFKDRRRKTQPYNLPCTGSVFRNPQGDYAGRLIEELGLKGFQIGGAQVSTLHANFIVNTGNATAKDVLSLIMHIKERVKVKYNLDLISEIELIGEG